MGGILVNDRCLHTSGGGVAVYLAEVLRHWPGRPRPVAFCSRHLRRRCRDDDAAGPEALRLRPLGAFLRDASLPDPRAGIAKRAALAAYEQLFRWTFRAGRYDVQFEPNHLPVDTPGPVVTTLHDLSVVEHPAWHPPQRVRRWEARLAAAVTRTHRWITVSAFTRRRMQEVLGIPGGRIEVIPLAGRRLAAPDGEHLAQLRRTGRLPGRYVLHLGTLEPRKNLRRLLDAWQRLPGALRRDVRLVLAGGIGWGDEAFWRDLAEHPAAGEVLASGYVSCPQAGALLAGAEAVAVPSHYEGFGLPVLEAMQLGRPVLTSCAEALVEVAGPAAEHIPAGDPAAWAAAIRRVLEDPAHAAGLGAAGRQRAQRFSWPETARRHAALFARVRQDART